MEDVVEPDPNRYVFFGYVFANKDVIDGPSKRQALLNGWHRMDRAFRDGESS